ncbi:helix-turn-helix domain-containing protein [Natrinema hispanicum]|uniref:HxlR-like helix-turn-helix n=1 Tax=Natrinema hispanicum TaxID=392421 RepID=A0A1I0CAI6_9EURY|nr:winged helix-turn-helix transcriptional regulator [Natrinema hispanicum]SDC52065.1 HxlR-like helix-turn-helix [Natrinema hispanicum]SET15903.1 HxlR-like helix-turn-helix [Natrinema hispanicum]
MEKRLVDRAVVTEKPVRIDYSLTELGESLAPVIEAIADWETDYQTAAADEARSIA